MSDVVNQGTEPTANPLPEQAVQQEVQNPAQQESQPAPAEPAPQEPQQTEQQQGEDKQENGLLDDMFQDKKEGEPEQSENPNVPEKYEFKVKDGETLSEEDAQAYGSVARELGLSQEQAQKLYDNAAPKIAEIFTRKSQAVMRQAQAGWNAALQNDAELGGENLNTTRLNVQKFLSGFGTPGYMNLMRATGLMNHPEMARVMARIGAAMGNDNVFINGDTKPAAKPNPLAALYDQSPELK